MPNYADVPYRHSTSNQTFSDLMTIARQRTVRVLLLGSSLHNPIASNGQRLAATLGACLHDQFGNNPGSDFACPGDNTGSSSNTKFPVRSTNGTSGYSSSNHLPAARIPPGWNTGYVSDGIDGQTQRGANFKLIPNGATLAITAFRNGFYIPTGPAGPTKARVIMYCTTHTGTSGGLLYEIRTASATAMSWTGTVIASGTLASAATLSDDDDHNVVKKVVEIEYIPGTAYIEVVIVGDSDNTAQVLGVEFQSVLDQRGIQIINASKGNYSSGGPRSSNLPTDTNSILLSHDECFQTLAALDFDAVLVCYGTNDSDVGSPASKADFKSNLGDLITLIRADTRSDMPVILASDPAWWESNTGTLPTPGQQTAISEYPVATYELADELANVLHINLFRALADAGWSYSNSAASAALYTIDGKHHTDFGAFRYASALVKGLVGGSDVSLALSESQIDDIVSGVYGKFLTHPASVASFDMANLNINLPSQRPIVFSWPNDGATITAAVKQVNGSYVDTVGEVLQISSAGGDYEYQLPFRAADRLQVPGSQRFRFTDGQFTGYLTVNYRHPVNSLNVAAPEDAF